jgi:hypothetical protein
MVVSCRNGRSNLCSTASNGCSTRSTRIHGGPGPVAVRKKETPTPDHARVVVSTGDGVIHPDTGHRPGSDLPVAAHLTTLDQAAAHQRPCHQAPRRHRPVRHRPGPGVGHRPGLLPRRRHRNPLRPPHALRHRPRRYVHRPAGDHRLRPRRCANCGAVPSPPGPHRRAAGARTPPGGTDLALGPSATLPRRGFRWRRPNSLRHHGRAGGSTAVAPGSYPPSAGGGGPSAWSVPPTTGAGAATGASLAGGVSRCRCSSRMCQSRSLLVLNSRPPVTHFTGIGGSSRSTGRLPGCTPPRRRRPHSQQDRSARRL